MQSLNRVINYWLECLKKEDALNQGISIHARTRALICPLDQDPFIFNRKDEVFRTQDEKIAALVSQAALRNEEVFYGYPLFYYFDQKRGAPLVAPLWVVKLNHRTEDGHTLLWKDEMAPTLGNQAAAKIGLRPEEVSMLNQQIEDIFCGDLGSEADLAKKCLDLLSEESGFAVQDSIDPGRLTNSNPFTGTMGPGLYNKSLMFLSESSSFNVQLLRDLTRLKDKKDLDASALSFLTAKNRPESKPSPDDDYIVLPFPMDEYQAGALKNILRNQLSVITGPPGTGKSQFISVLLLNLFIKGKSVLLVSHTNEAVDVVNRKINDHFKNMVFRTGNKELRHGLTGSFNDLSLDVRNTASTQALSDKGMRTICNEIINKKRLLLKTFHREERFHELDELFKIKGGFFRKCARAYHLWHLRRGPKRKELELAIRSMEESYVQHSQLYIRKVFAEHVRDQSHVAVRNFLHEISALRPNEDLKVTSCLQSLSILRLWSCTLKSLNRTFPMHAGLFDYVIFDEASQVDLPSAAPALYRAKNVVVVGDPMQLPHIAGVTKETDMEVAKAHGLVRDTALYPSKTRYYDVSLYRSAEACLHGSPVLLAKHYRSQDQIIHLCNQVFYGGQLQVASRLDDKRWPSDMVSGLFWDDYQGATEKPAGGSRLNRSEAARVLKVFQDILAKIQSTDLSIGIVTPYSRQRNEIERLIQSATSPEILRKHDVKILTTHKFQGSEKDIMIFSLVLSKNGVGNNDRWYNTHPQILNVALSRAKYLLCIVGDLNFCRSRNGVLKKIADTYTKIKNQEELESHFFDGNFDSPHELILYQNLQAIDFAAEGYRLIPKQVVKRYTLDFALIGKNKINIECDGFQHRIVEGLPVIEDVERDAFLEREGWTVLRFPNHQIATDVKAVVERILRAL